MNEFIFYRLYSLEQNGVASSSLMTKLSEDESVVSFRWDSHVYVFVMDAQFVIFLVLCVFLSFVPTRKGVPTPSRGIWWSVSSRRLRLWTTFPLRGVWQLWPSNSLNQLSTAYEQLPRLSSGQVQAREHSLMDWSGKFVQKLRRNLGFHSLSHLFQDPFGPIKMLFWNFDSFRFLEEGSRNSPLKMITMGRNSLFWTVYIIPAF